MKKSILFSSILLACASCTSLPEGQNTTLVEPGDSDGTIIAKAVRTVPSARQTAALDNEFIAFIHFGPNTFTGREWGTGTEDPTVFAPQSIDTDQWCEAMKDAGMKKVILTVKHHDGFVLYQTRYTQHGVMSSPYKDGQGDVFRELSESCRKYGLKLGLYLSPADLYQMEDGGLYGNESDATLRTIPRPVEGRPFADERSFQFVVDDYNEYFLNQLFELLTEYGPISEVWLDGAHPRRKGGQQYDYTSWRKLIRTLAPDAVIFGREDFRWVGNEAGETREREWNVLATQDDPATAVVFPDITDASPGEAEVLLAAEKPFYLHYHPAETDVSIRDGWFWRNDDEQWVRDADNVFDMYERVVGGNSILLLNIPPNIDGRFSPRDLATLKEVGRRIRETYSENLLKKGGKLTDDDASSWKKVGKGLELSLGNNTEFNRVVLCEPVQYTGERISAFTVEAKVDGEWVEIAKGETVGRKRIVRFDNVEADAIRIKVQEARADAIISEVKVHLCH